MVAVNHLGGVSQLRRCPVGQDQPCPAAGAVPALPRGGAGGHGGAAAAAARRGRPRGAAGCADASHVWAPGPAAAGSARRRRRGPWPGGAGRHPAGPPAERPLRLPRLARRRRSSSGLLRLAGCSASRAPPAPGLLRFPGPSLSDRRGCCRSVPPAAPSVPSSSGRCRLRQRSQSRAASPLWIRCPAALGVRATAGCYFRGSLGAIAGCCLGVAGTDPVPTRCTVGGGSASGDTHGTCSGSSRTPRWMQMSWGPSVFPLGRSSKTLSYIAASSASIQENGSIPRP